MTVGEKLASDFRTQVALMLHERGLTRYRLAKQLESHAQVVYRNLRADHVPTLELVVRYADALGCDVVVEARPLELVFVPRDACEWGW